MSYSLSNVIAWIGSLATVGFGALSIYFYSRTRATKKIACVIGYANLRRQLHPDVRISFRGNEVEVLSRLLAYVWNAGNTALRDGDVPDDQWPMLTIPPDRKILSVSILQASSPHISCVAHPNSDSSLQLSFSYLNPRDGAVVEVLASGSLQSGDARFTAPIIGGTEPEMDEFTSSSWREIWLPLLSELITGMAMALVGAAGYDFWRGTGRSAALFLALGLAAGSFAAGTYIQFRPLRRRLPPFARHHMRTVATAYGLK